ncbi:hypothetical protein P9112_007628 [Eukaryota sp. TZLM1-RC]
MKKDNEALINAQKALEDTRNQLGIYKSEAESLKTQLSNANQQLRAAQAHQDQLQGRVEALSSELQRARDEGTATCEELSQREAKLKELEAELQSSKASVDELQREDADLHAALQAKETEISAYSKKLEEEISALHQQRLAEISDLEERKQDEISQLKTSYEQKLNELRSNLDELSQRESEGVQKISALQSELLVHTESMKKDNEALINAQKALEDTRNQLGIYKSEAESLKTQLSNANQQLRAAQAHQDQLQGRVGALSSELQRARDEGTATCEELSQREVKLKELEAELQSSKASVDELQREDADLHAALQAKETEISAYSKKLEEEISALHQQRLAEISDLEERKQGEISQLKTSYEQKLNELRSNLDELSQRESEGVQKISALQSELLVHTESMKKDNEALINAQKALEDTRNQLGIYKSEAESLKTQLSNANQQLRAAQAHQDQLQGRVEALSSELQRARDEGTATCEELSQREAKLKELEAELQSSKASVDELQREDADLHAALQAKETEILAYSRKLEEEISALHQQRLAEISDLEERKQDEISQLKTSYEQKLNELRSNLDELSQRESEGVQKISALQSELLVHAESMKKDNEALINAQKALEDTRNQLGIYKSEAESLKTQLSNANQQLRAAQAHQDQLQGRVEALSSELQRARDEGTATCEELSQREAKLKQLEAELQSSKASVDELQREDADLHAALQAKETEISAYSKKLEEEISALHQQRLAEISDLEERKQDEISQLKTSYEQKLNELRSNLDELSQRESEGVQKISALQSELLVHTESMKKDNEALINAQKALEDTRNQLGIYKSEAESLKTQLSNANQQLRAAQAHQDQLQGRVEALSSELQRARDEGTATCEELSQREAKLKELEAELQSSKASVDELQREDADLHAALQAKETEISAYSKKLEEEISALHQQRLAEISDLEERKQGEISQLKTSYEQKLNELRSNLDELSQRESEGVQKISALQSELLVHTESMKKDNEALINAQKALEDTRNQLGIYKSEAESLKTQLSNANQHLRAAQAHQDQLQGRVEALSSELQRARDEGTATCEELSQREAKLKELEAELQSSKASVDELQREDADLHAALQAKETEISAYSKKLEEEISALHQQRLAEISDLEERKQDEIYQLKTSYEQKLNELRSNLDELSQRESEGVQKISALQSELLVHAESMKKDNEALINAQKALEDTRNQLGIYKSEAESLKTQLSNANQHLRAAQAHQDQLQGRVEALSSELQRARDEGTATCEELSQREAKLKELEAELQSSKASVDELQREDADLHAALQAKETEISAYSKKLEEEISALHQQRIAEISDLEERKQDEISQLKTSYEQKLNELRSNLDELSQRESEGVQKISALQSELLVHAESMKKDNEALINAQKALEDTRNQLGIYKSEAESLKTQLSNANQQLRAAQAHQDQLQGRVEALSSELQRARDEGTATCEELSQREAKLKQLEAELQSSKASVDELQREDADLHAALQAKETEARSCAFALEDEIRKLETQKLQELHQLKNIKAVEISQLKTSYEQKLNELRSNLDELSQRESQGVQKINVLESELLVHAESMKKDNEALINAQKALRSTQQELNYFRKHSAALANSLASAEETSELYLSEKRCLETKVNELTLLLDQIRSAKQESDQQLCAGKDRISILESELNATVSTVERLQQKEDALQSLLLEKESNEMTLSRTNEENINQRLAEISDLEERKQDEISQLKTSYEQKLNELRSNLDELSQRESEGVQKINVLESELLKFSQFNNDSPKFEATLRSKDSEISNLEEEIKQLRMEHSNEIFQINSLKAKELDEIQSSLQTQIALLNQQLDEMSSREAEGVAKVQILQKELEQASLLQEKEQSVLNQTRAKLAELEAINFGLTTSKPEEVVEHTESTDKLSELHEQLDAAVSRATILQAELDAQTRQNEQEKDDLLSKISVLESQISLLSDNLQALTNSSFTDQRIVSLEAEKEEHIAKINDLTEQLDSSCNRTHLLERELQMQITQAEKEQQVLLDQIHSLKNPSAAEVSSGTVSDNDTNIREQYHSLLSECEGKNKQYEHQIRKIREEHVIEVDKLSCKILSYQEELNSAAEKIHELQLELAKQSEYTSALDSELVEENSRISSELSLMRSENHRLNKELSSLQSKFDNTVNNLRTEYERQSSQDMEIAGKKIRELQSELQAQMRFSDEQSEKVVEETKQEFLRAFEEERALERSAYNKRVERLEQDILQQSEQYVKLKSKSEAKIQHLKEELSKLKSTLHIQDQSATLPPLTSRSSTPVSTSQKPSPPLGRPFSGRPTSRGRPSSAIIEASELLDLTVRRIKELVAFVAEFARSVTQKSNNNDYLANNSEIAKYLEEIYSLVSDSLPARNLVRKLQGLRYIAACGSLTNTKVQSLVALILDSFKKDDGFVEEFSKLGALNTIVSLLEAPSSKVTGPALSFVRFLSACESLVETLLDFGIIRPLLLLLADHSVDVKRNAAKALRNVMFLDKGKIGIRRENGLSVVCHQLEVNDAELERYVSRIILLASMNSENRVEFRVLNLLQVLVNALSSSDADVLKNLVGAMINIALNNKNKPELIQLGIIDKLVRVMACDDSDLLLYSLRVVCNLAPDDGFKKAIVNSPLPKTLVGTLLNSKTSSNLIKYTLRALSSISDDQELVTVMQSFSLVRPLCSFLNGYDSDIVCEALKLLFALCKGSTSAIKQIHNCNVLKVLIKFANDPSKNDSKSFMISLLGLVSVLSQNSEGREVLASESSFLTVLLECLSTNDERKAFSAEILSNICPMDKIKGDLRACGGLRPIVSNLNSEDSDIRTSLLICIAHLASSESNRPLLRDLDTIPTVLKLLLSTNEFQLRAAIKALYVLTLDEQAEAEVIHLGGLRTVLECLMSSDVEVKRRAMATCCNLSISDQHKEKFRSISAIPLIMKHLNHSDVKIKRDSARCIRNLAFNDKNKEVIIENNGLSLLLDLLSSSLEPQIQRYASRTLSVLSISADVRKSFDKEQLRVVVSALNTDDLETKRSVVGALINLSIPSKNKSALRQLGVLSSLTKSLTSSDIETVRYALRALTNLTFDPENEKALAGVSGHAAVVRWIGASDMTCHRNALSCLCNISCTTQSRRILAEFDIVSKLVRAILSPSFDDPKAIRDAIRVVSHMCLDESGRGSLRNQEGFNALKKGSQAVDSNTRIYTINCLAQLARDSKIAANEIKSNGFVPLVRECLVSDDSKLANTATELVNLLEK